MRVINCLQAIFTSLGIKQCIWPWIYFKKTKKTSPVMCHGEIISQCGHNYRFLRAQWKRSIFLCGQVIDVWGYSLKDAVMSSTVSPRIRVKGQTGDLSVTELWQKWIDLSVCPSVCLPQLAAVLWILHTLEGASAPLHRHSMMLSTGNLPFYVWLPSSVAQQSDCWIAMATRLWANGRGTPEVERWTHPTTSRQSGRCRIPQKFDPPLERKKTSTSPTELSDLRNFSLSRNSRKMMENEATSTQKNLFFFSREHVYVY